MSRYSKLEKRVLKIENATRLRIPVVDADGERMEEWIYPPRHFYGLKPHKLTKRKSITIREAFDALEEMCGVEITYQEIKGTSKVVIYDKD